MAGALSLAQLTTVVNSFGVAVDRLRSGQSEIVTQILAIMSRVDELDRKLGGQQASADDLCSRIEDQGRKVSQCFRQIGESKAMFDELSREVALARSGLASDGTAEEELRNVRARTGVPPADLLEMQAKFQLLTANTEKLRILTNAIFGSDDVPEGSDGAPAAIGSIQGWEVPSLTSFFDYFDWYAGRAKIKELEGWYSTLWWTWDTHRASIVERQERKDARKRHSQRDAGVAEAPATVHGGDLGTDGAAGSSDHPCVPAETDASLVPVPDASSAGASLGDSCTSDRSMS